MTNNGLLKLICLVFLLFPDYPSTPVAFAQGAKKSPEQALKLKSELINIRAVVSGKNGAVIDDLKKEDFEVLENNRPQEISFMSVERVGGRARAAKTEPAQPPTTAADKPASPAPNSSGRTVVLYVDTVNLMYPSLHLLKRELKKFVSSSMTEQDQIALVTTTASLGALEQFTRDRQMLNRAIDRLLPWQPEARTHFFTPFLAARVLDGDKEAKQLALCILDHEDGQPCRWDAQSNPFTVVFKPADEIRLQAQAKSVLLQAVQRRQMTLSALGAVLERLQEVPGQKILALFSDGFSALTSTGEPDSFGTRSVVSRAARAGVIIYSFDTRGLKQEDFVDATYGTFIAPPSFATFMGLATRDYERGLNILAADTGGKSLFNTNNLMLGLEKALQDNSVYYSLDYYPATDSEADKFREIKVRIKNHPEYNVRAQRGYLPADFKTETQALTARQRLIKAMKGVLPVTDIGVAAVASYLELEGDKAQVSLSIYADANTFQYAEQDGGRVMDVELGVAVVDTNGKIAATINEQMKGVLTPEQLEEAKRNGYKYSKRLELAPGIYNIRVGLQEARTEKIGTASVWVEVPDLKKGGLVLSDLLLIQAPAPEQKSAPDLLPRVSRQGEPLFKSGDRLSYLVKIYQPVDEAGLQLQVEFTQGGQAVFQTQWVGVTTHMIDKDSKGINVSQQFRLNSLKPGTYDVKVRVRDAKKKKTAESASPFVVEP